MGRRPLAPQPGQGSVTCIHSDGRTRARVISTHAPGRNGARSGPGGIGREGLLERAGQSQAIGRLDVEEVDNDQAADAPHAELSRDRAGRLEVDAQRRLAWARGIGERAGIDVDGGQRLGLVDGDRAARWQPYLALQRERDVGVDVAVVKQRAGAAKVLQARGEVGPDGVGSSRGRG